MTSDIAHLLYVFLGSSFSFSEGVESRIKKTKATKGSHFKGYLVLIECQGMEVG